MILLSSYFQPIDLVLLDIKNCMGKLDGVEMEINDCAYPLVKSMIVLEQ